MVKLAVGFVVTALGLTLVHAGASHIVPHAPAPQTVVVRAAP